MQLLVLPRAQRNAFSGEAQSYLRSLPNLFNTFSAAPFAAKYARARVCIIKGASHNGPRIRLASLLARVEIN